MAHHKSAPGYSREQIRAQGTVPPWARESPPGRVYELEHFPQNCGVYTVKATREGICGGSVHAQMLARMQGTLLVNGSEFDLQGPSWVGVDLSC